MPSISIIQPARQTNAVQERSGEITKQINELLCPSVPASLLGTKLQTLEVVNVVGNSRNFGAQHTEKSTQPSSAELLLFNLPGHKLNPGAPTKQALHDSSGNVQATGVFRMPYRKKRTCSCCCAIVSKRYTALSMSATKAWHVRTYSRS